MYIASVDDSATTACFFASRAAIKAEDVDGWREYF